MRRTCTSAIFPWQMSTHECFNRRVWDHGQRHVTLCKLRCAPYLCIRFNWKMIADFWIQSLSNVMQRPEYMGINPSANQNLLDIRLPKHFSLVIVPEHHGTRIHHKQRSLSSRTHNQLVHMHCLNSGHGCPRRNKTHAPPRFGLWRSLKCLIACRCYDFGYGKYFELTLHFQILIVAQSVAVTISTSNGLGKHTHVLGSSQISAYLKVRLAQILGNHRLIWNS